MSPDDMAVLRRACARQVLAAAGVRDPALEDALAETERERFLGSGPWQIMRLGRGYAATPDADPVYLYTDDLVAIDAARGLNNGQPSFLATLIHAAAIRPGDHVVHVGTGTGYYTAVMARLAGPGGRVTGIEVDPAIAARAARNLAGTAGIAVLAGDGGRADFDPADVVFVNAGAARPSDLWLDRLKEGGRIVLPLTAAGNFDAAAGSSAAGPGAVFVVERRGAEHAVRRLSFTRIFPCAGQRGADDERRLAEAFARGDGSSVRRLHRRAARPGEDAWLDGDGWCLTA